jgi:hypothetical protein
MPTQLISERTVARHTSKALDNFYNSALRTHSLWPTCTCLRHGWCRHMMPRCLYQNCWQSFRPCRYAIYVCHHHVPSTVACEDCIREVTIRGLEDIFYSTLDNIPPPSTSGTQTDHASPDTSHDSSITCIRDNLSEASTVIRDNGQADNNLAGLYQDE